jgi:hypothetical protein
VRAHGLGTARRGKDLGGEQAAVEPDGEHERLLPPPFAVRRYLPLR